VLVYPTDRILSGGCRRPRFVAWASRVWWIRTPRWSAHKGGNTGVSNPSMRSPWIPRLGAISVFAPRSPFGYVGRRWGSFEPRITTSPFGRRFRQTASSSSVRRGALRGDEAARVVGASPASAEVVLYRSESAGHGFRARDDECGGFGPVRRQRWSGYVRKKCSFL
jgi:hypothetical protein